MISGVTDVHLFEEKQELTSTLTCRFRKTGERWVGYRLSNDMDISQFNTGTSVCCTFTVRLWCFNEVACTGCRMCLIFIVHWSSMLIVTTHKTPAWQAADQLLTKCSLGLSIQQMIEWYYYLFSLLISSYWQWQREQNCRNTTNIQQMFCLTYIENMYVT